MYHLYDINNEFTLSMVEPSEWAQRWIGSFRLNADGRWLPVEVSEAFQLRDWVSGDERLGRIQ